MRTDLGRGAPACREARDGGVGIGHRGRPQYLQWSAGYPHTRYPFLDITDETHHEKSHRGTNQTEATRQLVRINVWYSEQLAKFLQLLRDTPEGNGTMLDNTIVVSCSEIATSGTHDWRSMPFVLAGGGDGTIRPGRYLRYTNTISSRLMVSLCHAMGLEDVQSFGGLDDGSGPLPRLS